VAGHRELQTAVHPGNVADHPDSNGGDRSAEHKLQRVVRAGKLLKASGLMRA
jgi:hypothetical protein